MARKTCKCAVSFAVFNSNTNEIIDHEFTTLGIKEGIFKLKGKILELKKDCNVDLDSEINRLYDLDMKVTDIPINETKEELRKIKLSVLKKLIDCAYK